jgi:hypothetical protein
MVAHLPRALFIFQLREHLLRTTAADRACGEL